MYDGVINVYKEQGFTSHDVVAKLRGILHMKKIGHTGTLDPDATGVLPVCIGSATKLCDMLTDKTKTYIATMKLGVVTDTQDISGKILKSFSGEYPDSDDIKNAVMSFVGEYDQIPPMYSALKVNGKKLYELAREGIEVERKPRRVVINNIRITDVDMQRHTVEMIVDCSKGTYIRTLCNDIGDKLGCGACMKKLVRNRVASFKLENALTLSQIEHYVKENLIFDYIVSVEEVFSYLGSIIAKKSSDKLLINGNRLYNNDISFTPAAGNNYSCREEYAEGMLVKTYDSAFNFRAVYIYCEADNCFKPYKMFQNTNGV